MSSIAPWYRPTVEKQSIPSSAAIVEADPTPTSGNDDLSSTVASLSLSPSSLNTTTLLHLPDELIFHIFSLLPIGDYTTFPTLLATQQTCTRLSKIVSDPALWRPLLAWDYEVTSLYPELFERRDRREGVTERYYKLKKNEWEVEGIVRKLAKASSKREQLLDRLCLKAGAYGQGVLKRLSAITSEQDPRNWLSIRYWAKVALGLTERVTTLHDWAGYMKSGARTGRKRGDECWALASFGAYTGDDSRQVIHQFAHLQLSDLEEYLPLEDMSLTERLRHVCKAVKEAAWDSRAWEYDSLLLSRLLRENCDEFEYDHQDPLPATPAAVIILVEMLLKVEEVADVAILEAYPDLILAVTFHSDDEVLFLDVSKDAVLTRGEVSISFPNLELDSILTKENRVPLKHRFSIGSLIHRTDFLLEQVYRRQNPSLDFDRDPAWSPGWVVHQISPTAHGAFVAVHHLRLLRNIFNPNHTSTLEQALTSTPIPTHSIFERSTLNRVFKSFCTGSPKNFPDLEFMDYATEEYADVELPDHMNNGYCPCCDDAPPTDYMSFVKNGGGKKWFPRGHWFLDGTLDAIAVVVAFEKLSKGEKVGENFDPGYLCVFLTPGRRGHIVRAFIPHSLIEKATVPPPSALLDPSLEVGQFFRAHSRKDGLLLPNAWLERLLCEMDQKESANKRWWRNYNAYTDAEKLYEEELAAFGREGADEEKELRRSAFAVRRGAWGKDGRGRGKGKAKARGVGVTTREEQKKKCICGEKEKIRGKGRGELAKIWTKDDLVLDD